MVPERRKDWNVMKDRKIHGENNVECNTHKVSLELDVGFERTNR